jgi:PAS domain S-box-containing protein
MKPLDRTEKSSLSSQPQDSQKLIAELELSVAGLIRQLLATQAGLEHEVAERQRLEEKFRDLLELIPRALMIVNEQDWILVANSRTEQLFGYSQAEILGWRVERLLTEYSHSQYRQYRASLMAKLSGQFRGARLNLFGSRRDGYEFPVEMNINLLTQAKEPLLLISLHDLTQRQQEEADFRRSNGQLRELSARLQAVREEERTRIARTIHDELGQSLTGLKMDLAWLQGHMVPQQPVLLEKMQAMSDLIDTLIQAVRRISTELRPAILDLGLVATIEWQLQEFQSRTGIEGKLISAPEETTLDNEGSTTVFRIFQEILTNIVRHAQATQVKVTLKETATFLTLQVQDNGRGITESEIHNPKSIGLLGMQERARLRAGEVQFLHLPGQGTRVTVRLPLSMNN